MTRGSVRCRDKAHSYDCLPLHHLMDCRVTALTRRPGNDTAVVCNCCAVSDPFVWDVGGLVVARLGLAAEPCEAVHVDADELAVALHDLARDQHGVDVLG